MSEVKVTQREMFLGIMKVVEESNLTDAEKLEYIEFLEKKIGQLDSKAEKAKERAAQVKAKGDELRTTVEGLLTNELQVIDAIVEQVNDPEVTKAKVTARLTQLVGAGIAVKETISVDGNKRTAYKLAEIEA